MRLDQVRGHDRLKRLLGRALERDRLPPSLLLAGPDGVGKKTLALAVGQALLCEQAPVAEPCGGCRMCRRIESGRHSLDDLRQRADRRPDEDTWRNFRVHPDLVLAEGWWLTRTGRPRPEPEIRVDQVRDLISEIAGAPFEARRRFFVIDDAHTMNEAAQNALLKSLEEPAPRSHVVLVSSAPLGLLHTIRSRCQLLRFGPLPRSVVAGLLHQRAGLAEDEARLRAGLAGGSVGAALQLESEAYRDARERLLSLLESLDGMSPLDRMRAAQDLEQSEAPALLLTTLRSLLRDVAAARAGADPASLVHADVAPRLTALALKPVAARASELAERAAQARGAVRGFANRLLTFDVLVDALAGD